MTLRTPRRRISPRTKRRYRAIREFFRRALGSSSQQEIKINSSIAVNVSNLKHKIVGIEHQLSEVNKHCRDLTSFENNFRREAEHLLPSQEKHSIETIKEQTEASLERRSKSASTGRPSKPSDTQVLYNNSLTGKSDESDYAPVYVDDKKYTSLTVPDNMNAENHNNHYSKIKKKKRFDHEYNTPNEYNTNLRKHKSAYENLTSICSTGSYHCQGRTRVGPRLDARYPEPRHEREYHKHREYIEPAFLEEPRGRRNREITRKDKSETLVRHQEGEHKSRKKKREKLDQEFIADIIKRQYKPVKLFDRRRSDISQFSAPVCRDQEFPIQENIQEGDELCSCCCDGPNRSKYVCNQDLSDVRSICDTRLYSCNRNVRSRRRRVHVDDYNDSTLYDLIPVKEKPSPKMKRKFVEYNMMADYYREVPPSPRSLRPRLNLKAQYHTEYDDYMAHAKPHKTYLQNKYRRQKEYVTPESDIASEIVQSRNRRPVQKSQKQPKIENQDLRRQEVGTMSMSQCPFANEKINVTAQETTLNKTQETDLSSDKTDKALCEIKDILQTFLHEIKKETTASQCDKLETTNKNAEKFLNDHQNNGNLNTGAFSNPQASFNSYGAPHCSMHTGYLPQFPNPCCYPMLPVCPMNCIQSNYALHSGSFTCQACAASRKENGCQDCARNNKNISTQESNNVMAKSSETEELIKEIYKVVAQSPNSVRRQSSHKKYDRFQRKEINAAQTKELTSRSVGGSSGRVSRHDAQVGTPTMKCYSKSCEAIGSRMLSDTYTTNGTQSDTVLEKLSLEITQSESELSTDSTVEKSKKGKFGKVLRSFGLFKRKKKDAIEELSESESSQEVSIKPKPPYREQIQNYAMYGQGYYYPPYHQDHVPHGYGPHASNDSRRPYCPMQAPHEMYAPHRVYHETIHEHSPAPQYRGRPRPTAPPCPAYEHMHGHPSQPQGPLCLKEIEVKSTGTQSDRKMSFFHKIAKMPPTVRGAARSEPLQNNATQTQTKGDPVKAGLFSGWKNLQTRVENDMKKEPEKYKFRTQKKLAEGNDKIRNAVLKKLFYKRNPFSPRNLIVKTLLGNDKSSFGEQPTSYRPRMFL